MGEERWLVVPRWGEFQHYGKRDPTWIKNYRRLVHNDGYAGLSLAERGCLHGVWLLFAETGGVLSEAVARQVLVRSAADARRFTRHLERLNHAGFIEVSASKPLALRYHIASAERDRREEREERASNQAVDNPPASALEDVNPFAELPRRRGSMVDPGKSKSGSDWDCPVCGIRKKNQQQLDEHLDNVHGHVFVCDIDESAGLADG